MPRFIKNGPIVPDKLVQELEDDRVIVFCGAGISAGGGLPTFRSLVEHCYTELGAALPAPKDAAWSWPDRMLGELEADFPDQMRAKVLERLDKSATDLTMHRAILDLARLKRSTNGYRLVTTNFDLFFEQARPELARGIDLHSGPILPIPLNDSIPSWSSVVYLHGRLEPNSHNRHLVLTSSDFGRAYLTEGWAARFVTRLFAEFTVLFIGYSLNDPVLRYMTDAFAAEDALTRGGQRRSPAYIFVPHKGQPPDPRNWRQRRLEPIFYREANAHRALKNTLVGWARARADYLANVDTIVRRYGTKLPSALEPSYAANLVWAVCERADDQGHGARIFSRLGTCPPIEWLQEFERRDNDVRTAHDEERKIAAVEGREAARPPAYHIEMLFPKSPEAFRDDDLSAPAVALIRWLCRHLENEQFTNWAILKLGRGRRAHPRLRWAIRLRLDEDPPLATGYACFWRIVASEGVWANNSSNDFTWADFFTKLETKVGTGWFDQELTAAMRPYLALSASFRGVSGQAVDPNDFSSIASAKVELAHKHISHLIDQINKTPGTDQFWRNRLDRLTNLLREVFDLYATVGQADIAYDPSSLQRPSIEPHQQNRHRASWTRLFDLIWSGWCAVDAVAPAESRQWVKRWRSLRYPGFRRLALAAANHSNNFTPAEKLEALLHG